MNDMDYITDLNAADVLLGRGSGPNDHEGNIRFRQRVAERKTEYMATNHRWTKAKIAQEIVDTVYAENGRFLRRLENEELIMFNVPDGVDAWVLATEDIIMEKAKQALRQNTIKAVNKTDEPNKPKLSPKVSPKVSPKPTPKRLSPKPTPRSYIHASVPVLPIGMEDDLELDCEPLPLTRGYTLDPAILSSTGSLTTIHDRRSDSPKTGRFPVSAGPLAGARDRHSVTPPPPPPARMQAPIPMNNISLSKQDLDLQDDSILSHLPSHMRAQFMPQQQRAPARVTTKNTTNSSINNSNQQSMDQIPSPEDGHLLEDPYSAIAASRGGTGIGGGIAPTGSRQASMTIQDLAQFHQNRRGEQQMHHEQRYQQQASEDNMSVLMDSFSKMRTSGANVSDGNSGGGSGSSSGFRSSDTGKDHRSMYASTDTMGTIEPIGVGSMADMSFATMNDSSTWSVLRGQDPFASCSGGVGSDPDNNKASPSPIASGGRVIVERDPQMGGGNYPYATAAVPTTGSGGASGAGVAGEPATLGRYDSAYAHADLVQRAARYQSGNLHNNSNNLNTINSAILEGNEYAVGGERPEGLGGPRPVRLMEDQPDEYLMDSMGMSSVEMLKAALQSSSDWGDQLTQQKPASNYRHEANRG